MLTQRSARRSYISMHLLWFISRSASGGWRRCIVETLSASEERTEHSTESLAHGAVDEEVEWISDGDAAINEQRSSVACSVAEQVDVERVFDDDEQQQGRQRHFHDWISFEVFQTAALRRAGRLRRR